MSFEGDFDENAVDEGKVGMAALAKMYKEAEEGNFQGWRESDGVKFGNLLTDKDRAEMARDEKERLAERARRRFDASAETAATANRKASIPSFKKEKRRGAVIQEGEAAAATAASVLASAADADGELEAAFGSQEQADRDASAASAVGGSEAAVEESSRTKAAPAEGGAPRPKVAGNRPGTPKQRARAGSAASPRRSPPAGGAAAGSKAGGSGGAGSPATRQASAGSAARGAGAQRQNGKG